MKKFRVRQFIESQTRHGKRHPHLTNCNKIKPQDKKNWGKRLLMEEWKLGWCRNKKKNI